MQHIFYVLLEHCFCETPCKENKCPWHLLNPFFWQFTCYEWRWLVCQVWVFVVDYQFIVLGRVGLEIISFVVTKQRTWHLITTPESIFATHIMLLPECFKLCSFENVWIFHYDLHHFQQCQNLEISWWTWWFQFKILWHSKKRVIYILHKKIELHAYLLDSRSWLRYHVSLLIHVSPVEINR